MAAGLPFLGRTLIAPQTDNFNVIASFAAWAGPASFQGNALGSALRGTKRANATMLAPDVYDAPAAIALLNVKPLIHFSGYPYEFAF